MIMGLEKLEKECLLKLKYKLEILNTDLHSTLLELNKGKINNISIKTVRSFLNFLKPMMRHKRK